MRKELDILALLSDLAAELNAENDWDCYVSGHNI